jgi:hypothetical protein
MKVICIEQCKFNTGYGDYFTIEPGEWLEVEDNYPLTYQFERNGRQWIWKDRFITLEEHRERQLDKMI